MRFHTLGAAVLTITLNIVKCQDSAKAEDENRPYEFGFNIEGYQHRHEKKDEKGIIMGEFGFITGDGVYHITVYATDENGNFKILKMKNIFIGLPTEKPLMPTHEDGVLMPIKVTEMMMNQLEEKKPEGIAGCGGCIIPVKPASESDSKPPPMVEDEKKPHLESVEPMLPGEKPLVHLMNPIMLLEKPMIMHAGEPMEHPLTNHMKPAPFMLTSPGIDEEAMEPLTVETPISITEDQESSMTSPMPIEELLSGKLEENSNQMTNMDSIESSDKKPTIPPTIVMQMINAMKDHGKPENHDKHPTKIPQQQMISQDELLGILYKYNYTLSYHGHHEIGNKQGDKSGEYFSNGRDGVGINVKYKANQFGYQPNITFRKLSESETPKKETEKIQNKLHGYEFKWFYRR